MSEESREPKINIDSGWKDRARKEKTRAAEQEKAEAASSGRPSLPRASLTTHLSQLITEAAIALGEMENPITKTTQVDIELAGYIIDTLDMLRVKTEGNREDDESRMLEGALYNLRLRYVDLSGKSSD